jgi:hypothetical protein
MTFALVGALALLLERELAIATGRTSPIAILWACAVRQLCDEPKKTQIPASPVRLSWRYRLTAQPPMCVVIVQ